MLSLNYSIKKRKAERNICIVENQIYTGGAVLLTKKKSTKLVTNTSNGGLPLATRVQNGMRRFDLDRPAKIQSNSTNLAMEK